MYQDHLKILSMINDFEQAPSEEAIQRFHEFTQHLLKHFQLEEETIFSSFALESSDTEDYSIYQQVVSDHNRVQDIIDSLKDNLSHTQGFDTVTLRDRLRHHVQFEESTVYPKLDNRLTLEEKQFMARELNTLL
jgi:hemerythrin-like domain-containing protein